MIPNGMVPNESDEANENDSGLLEGSGLTVGMIVQGLSHLGLDTLLVYLLWNNALVPAVAGVHQIGIFGALGIIFLARSISRG